MIRVHIVGSGPRTGTTLLAEAMITCFHVDSYAKHEQVVSEGPVGGEGIHLSKFPRDIIRIKPHLMLDPDLHVICLIRDPRDTVVSKHGKQPEKYWGGLNFWNQYIPYWRELRHHPRFLTIRYEDFVSAHDEIQKKIDSFLPFLKSKAPFSRFHELADPPQDSVDAMRGIRPIRPDSVGRWKNHLPRIKSQIQIHGSISDDLIEFGYENDEHWLQLLDGVDPDPSTSFRPEFSDRFHGTSRRGVHVKEWGKATVRRSGIHPRQLRKLIGR